MSSVEEVLLYIWSLKMRHFSVLGPALKQAEGAQQKHNKGSVESVVKFRNTEFLGSRVIDRFLWYFLYCCHTQQELHYV